MSYRERYGIRDLTYSKWHRLETHPLRMHFTYIDLDAIEYCKRCKQPLALIELAQDVNQKTKPTTITCNLAKMASLPAYLVFYKKVRNKSEISSFRVHQVYPIQMDELTMTPEEYIQFLIRLRNEHNCYKNNSI